MATTYVIDQARFPAYRLRSVRDSFLFYGLIGALALLALNRGDFSRSGLIGLALAFGAELVVIGLIVWASLRTLKRQVATLRIVLDEATISREVAGLPALTLRFDEVTRVEEYPGNGLALRTANPRAFIFLTELLEDYAALRELLARRWPFVRKQSPTRLLLRNLAWSLLPAACLVLLATAPTRPLLFALGAGNFLGALAMGAYFQRHENVPRWFKAMSWAIAPMVVVIIALRLIVLR